MGGWRPRDSGLAADQAQPAAWGCNSRQRPDSGRQRPTTADSDRVVAENLSCLFVIFCEFIVFTRVGDVARPAPAAGASMPACDHSRQLRPCGFHRRAASYRTLSGGPAHRAARRRHPPAPPSHRTAPPPPPPPPLQPRSMPPHLPPLPPLPAMPQAPAAALRHRAATVLRRLAPC